MVGAIQLYAYTGTQIAAGTGRVQIGQYNLNGTTWQSYSNANLNLSSFAGSVMRLVFEWRNDELEVLNHRQLLIISY
jgi:hypothetical protein